MLGALPIVLVICTLMIVWVKKIVSTIKILSIQSLFLGVIAFIVAKQTGIGELYIIAALTIIMRAILIPSILYYTMRKIGPTRETEKFLGRELSLLTAVGTLLVGYYATHRLTLSIPYVAHEYLPISIAMLLVGLFIMLTHQQAIMQGVGLIVMENSLFLVALVTTYGMPFLVDIGVFLDVFVAVILISRLTHRIDQVYHSIHTDRLRKLKG
jgi:hydrogenase-4 component E